MPLSAFAATGAGPIVATSAPSLAIPDRASISSKLTVSDAAKIESLSINLDLSHTYRGDLKVILTSPSGTSAIVHNRSGGSADDLKGSFDLSAFAGEGAKGEWTLTVADELGGDVGTLHAWGIEITPAEAPPPRPTDNGFTSRISGRYPPVATGSFFTQIKQAKNLAQLALSANQSVNSRGRNPTDFEVRAKLRALGVMLPTSDTSKTTRHDFFSRLEGISPQEAYAYFVNNPGEVFGSAGLKVRPAVGSLQNGQRLMLEGPGSPDVWFPIEVRLDAAAKTIKIVTLDGHPLRGTNDFSFASDGEGGTRVTQATRYQMSSKAAEIGMGADDLQRQHDTWEQVHAQLFSHFHGEA